MVHTPEQMGAELAEIDVDIALLFPDHLLKLASSRRPTTRRRWRAPTTPGSSTSWSSRDARCSAPSSPARRTRRTRRARSSATPTTRDRRGLPAVRRARPAVGPPPLRPDLRRRAGRRPAGAAARGDVTSPVFPFNIHGFDTEFARHATSHTFSIMANVVSMVTTGVAVRFPSCGSASPRPASPGCRSSESARQGVHGAAARGSVPDERPSHYLKRFFYATQPIEEPERLRDMVTLIELYDGEDTTMFASDWPHHDFDHPMKVHQMPFSRRAAAQDLGGERARAVRDRPRGAAAVTEVVVGRVDDFPEGTHRVVTSTGARSGCSTSAAPPRAAEPLPAPERAALRGPRDDRDARRRRRRAAGSRAGR